jgi:mannose-1-phosphate guanylyltransferase
MQTIILAGGSGERFWPLSTKETPKQFLKLFGDKSLIRQTYERLEGFVKPEDVFVITSHKDRERTMKEIPELSERNILGEPFRRNTAAACMSGTLMASDGEMILVLPADHRIPDKESFWKFIKQAERGAEEFGGLFTFGIKPTRPETGYGYIEAGEKFSDDVLKAVRFREKPNKEIAEEYLESGNFFWNSGMFLWKKECFIREMQKCSPEVFNALEQMNPFDSESVEDCYEHTASISIDYALMEKSEHVRIIPVDLEWSDVGNWESIRELEGYSSESERVCLIDSERIFVSSQSGKKIGVIGLNNIVVVETDEGILVCREEDCQKVREVSRYFNLK